MWDRRWTNPPEILIYFRQERILESSKICIAPEWKASLSGMTSEKLTGLVPLESNRRLNGSNEWSVSKATRFTAEERNGGTTRSEMFISHIDERLRHRRSKAEEVQQWVSMTDEHDLDFSSCKISQQRQQNWRTSLLQSTRAFPRPTVQISNCPEQLIGEQCLPFEVVACNDYSRERRRGTFVEASLAKDLFTTLFVSGDDRT